VQPDVAEAVVDGVDLAERADRRQTAASSSRRMHMVDGGGIRMLHMPSSLGVASLTRILPIDRRKHGAFTASMRLLLTVGVASFLCRSVRADWPHLRGANYDAVSSEIGLADSWPETGSPQLWSRELGQGHSGFIVAEGKLYTQRQTLGGQFVLCLDLDSGQTVWESRYDWAWQPGGAYPGPYATPTWYRGKVYYSSPTGLVGCMDARTGATIWSLNVREKFKGDGFTFGYAVTPLVEGGRVILPVGGPSASLVALDADDGHTVWATGSDPASYCPALALDFRGRRCVVGYMQNCLLIVDAANGKPLHRHPLSSNYDEHSAWPLYREPHLMLAAPFHVPAALVELRPGPDDSLLGVPQWTNREFSNDILSSVLYGEHVYGFDLKQLQASKHRTSRGTFRCIDWSTGKTNWSTDRVGHASVLAADGKLFLVNDTGSLLLARADPTQYRELARVQLFDDEICWTPPTLWNGRLYVRSPTRAVCLYVGRPENLPSGATTTSSPTRSRAWRFDACWLLSREREYPNDAPSWEEMTTWFAACVLFVFGGAAVTTGLVVLIARRLLGKQLCGWLTFLGFAFVLGFVGTNVLSTLLDRCLFTWPASLYAVFHATLRTCHWAAQHPSDRRAGWVARGAIVGFLLVGYGYFELCKTVGMFIAWGFLIGFLAAAPFTLLAVRAEAAQRRRWMSLAWMLVAFTAFFWSFQGLMLLKTAPGGE
jgi:outer membrane protein assembly factor BamB